MQLLDGKTISLQILADLKSKIDTLDKKPVLDIIIIGDDPASLKYVQMKQKKAAMLGIGGTIHHLSINSTTESVLELINKLNKDSEITAYMVQLPLPAHIKPRDILNSIDPSKDADGLTAANLGLLFQNRPSAIAPATPLGIITLLKKYDIDPVGKNTVIIGRSSIVGLPLAAMFINLNSTVTICHSHTKNLTEITNKADILVAALGKSKFVGADMIKDGAVVIDVGTNFDESGHLTGDVDYDNVAPKTSFITPVPGGIGPMTIASLLQNTYNIFINNQK